MLSIIEQLVGSNEVSAINSLMSSEKNTLSILKSLGHMMLEKDDIFVIDSQGQIMLIVAAAPFIKSDEECIQVTEIVKWGMKEPNVFPIITEHKDKDLAYRCLISCSFFHSAMENRTNRYGAPSISYYRNIGIKTFKDIGYEDVSDDFSKWECYLNEMFL